MAVFRLFNFNSSSALSCRNLLGSKSTIKFCQEQHAAYSAVKTKFLEKLGIPLPPKRPLSPYLMFTKELRPKVIQNQPELKVKEIFKIMAEEWHNCDSELKKSYQKKYLSEMQNYLAALEKYKNSITPEQKDIMETAKAKQKKAVEQAKISAKQEELGRPKKPSSPFFVYLEDIKSQWRDGKYTMFVKEKSQEWKNMSDDMKEKYVAKAKAEMSKYKEDLLKWEEKMIRQGHIDLVRNTTTVGKKSKKPKEVET